MTITATPRKPRTLELPQFDFRAVVDGTSLDKAKRRFVARFSTGVRVLRQPYYGEPYLEELEISERAIRMNRLNGGTGLLLFHDRFTPESHVGTTERGWVEKEGTNGEGDARVACRLSMREDRDKYWRDLEDGILCSVSVFYRVHKFVDVTTADDPMTVLRAVDWEPMEVTLCSVPEDASGAVLGTRSAQARYQVTIEETPTREDGSMKPTGTQTPETPTNTPAPEAARTPATPPAAPATPAAPAASPAPAPEAARATSTNDVELGRLQERQRTTEILRAVQAAGGTPEYARELCEGPLDIAGARAAISAKFQAGGGPESRQTIVVTRDERETFRMAATEALLHRSDRVKNPITDRAKRWVGYSLMELARECCRLRGIDTTGLSRMEVAGRAMGSGDFPAMLENVAHKTLRAQYDTIPQAWRNTICRVGTAVDFKTFNRVQLSGAPALLLVEEGASIQHGALTDGKQGYALLTYARKLVLTRRAIVNDDLDGFLRLPQLMAAAARRLEDSLVYGVLTANAALADGTALFHTTNPTARPRNNLGVKTLTNAGLTEARTAMRKQKGLALEPLNLEMRYLVVPAALETDARQLCSNEWIPATPGVVNTFKGLTPIIHPLLDAASALVWYAAASIDQVDMLEIFFLEGENGPVMEDAPDSDIDGRCWTIREDVVAGATDYVGLFKSAGTTP